MAALSVRLLPFCLLSIGPPIRFCRQLIRLVWRLCSDMGLGELGAFSPGMGTMDHRQICRGRWRFPTAQCRRIVPVHPTPLYETGMSVIAFGLLWSIRKQKEGTPGWLLGGAFILAGIERFIAEFFRLNQPVLLRVDRGTTYKYFDGLLLGVVLSIGSRIVLVTEEAPAPIPPVIPQAQKAAAVIISSRLNRQIASGLSFQHLSLRLPSCFSYTHRDFHNTPDHNHRSRNQEDDKS